MTLPNAELAVVPSEKVVKYLLDGYHPQNKGKAAFYEMAGYRAENGNVLAEALQTLAKTGTIIKTEPTPRGIKYVVQGEITAPNGRTYQLLSVWIIQSEQNEPRLVTAYPTKK
ncbi:MAG: hypothetical protein U0X91_07235 [Spirosomataceae bacterium]